VGVRWVVAVREPKQPTLNGNTGKKYKPESPRELEERAQRLMNMAASMQSEAMALMVKAAMRREELGR